MSQRSAQKAESRTAILRSAAALLREKGVPGMSVERAMSGAGLTVGAFYAHFAGKKELLDDAFALALDEIGALLLGAAAGRSGRDALVEVADAYLSEAHRDHPEIGCPLPGVAASALPSPGRALPHLVARGVEDLVMRLVDLGGGELPTERALALVVLLVGGQVVARATRGTPLSSGALSAARQAARAILLPPR